ncbi:MAG: glycosyltransferase [Fibrobacter sp.]|nr:glycosyltransferase [Fibrobacter sp.]
MFTKSDYTVEFFHAQSGYLSARLYDLSNNALHVHSLVKPEIEAQYFEDLEIWGDSIILAGTGIGYHLYGIIDRIRNKNVLLLEYFNEFADLCRSEVVKDCNSVGVITSKSSDFKTTIMEFTKDEGSVQVIRHPVSYRVNKQFYDYFINQVLSGGTTQHRSGQVLLLGGRFFLQKELADACEKLDCKASVIHADQIKELTQYESEINRVIQRDRPEMILSVNMLGIDSEGICLDYARRFGIPVAVWFVDDPSPILLQYESYIDANIHAFCWERNYLEMLKKKRFGSVTWLPLATDPEIFTPCELSRKKTSLGFVGSAMGGEFLDNIKSKFMWKQELELLVREAARRMLVNKECDVDKMVKTLCADLGLQYPYNDNRNETWFKSYIIHTASMMKRRNLIGQLLPLGIELFGDPDGWKLLLGEGITVHPNIDYRTGLASVYRGITITINSTSCQMRSAVNQRVFDIPACGGFVITDNQSDIFELFDKDEIVIYSTIDELRDLISHYRTHESGRMKISDKARIRILNEHTISKRLETIINSVRK